MPEHGFHPGSFVFYARPNLRADIDPTGHTLAQFPELGQLPTFHELSPDERGAEIERRGVWSALAM